MAAGGTKTQKRAKPERKKQILETATALFKNQGYHTTSLDDIAEVVGFTKPAIYYYFKSKEDILFAIVDEIVVSALARIRLIAEDSGSPTERLRDLLVENTRAVLENLEANTVFYNSRGMLSPERESDVQEREREYTRVVRALYVEGVEKGEFLDIDPAVATATLLGASIWSYTWYAPGGRLSREKVAQEVAELLLSGYRVSPVREQDPTRHADPSTSTRDKDQRQARRRAQKEQ
ncbi:TetR/AcrR family transcriptional regulator [Actinomadura sp. 1N219]|uniref:TetR/AcrR family transcriptional regulator n=1 Tax=Actinomadura sp. 1N219 TaxID=3375152 RepID=UPI0037A098AD